MSEEKITYYCISDGKNSRNSIIIPNGKDAEERAIKYAEANQPKYKYVSRFDDGDKTIIWEASHFGKPCDFAIEPATTNIISTQLEEAPEKHDTLNPKLWDIEKNELKPEVSDKVLEIAKDFTDELDEDEVKYKLLDIKLVGSNCSYNYNKASDLDVHLVFDLSIYDDDEKEKMAELLYNYARSLWNKNHTVEFYGIPVEIYVETENSEDKNILENADKENSLTPGEEELIIEASNGPFEEISFEDLCKL